MCLFFSTREYLHLSEGNDVIRGCYTAQPLAHLRFMYPSLAPSLERDLRRLEEEGAQQQVVVMAVEFVIQAGELFYLSSRRARVSPLASVAVSVDLVRHHRLSREEAVLRLDPGQMDYFLRPCLDPAADISRVELGRGLKTSQGEARRGEVAFNSIASAVILHIIV
jgi:pyruvate, orthophosphate dikinase